MQCAGCRKQVSLVGGNVLKLTGKPDRQLCMDCAQAVESVVKEILVERRFSNIRKTCFSPTLQEA